MCGITFRRANKFEGFFAHNGSRGTDGFGVISKDLTIDRRYPTLRTPIAHQEELDKLLVKKGDEFVLFHHRKQSIGSHGLENTHPFKGKRWIVLQNGSSKLVSDWGAIEFGENTHSDTFFLARILEKEDSLESVFSRLESISKVDKLGVVMVVCRETKRILYYSDGARSFYFSLSKDKKYINYCGSLKDGDNIEYKNEGFMTFNFSGKILQNGIEKRNYIKPTPKQQYSTKNVHSSYYAPLSREDSKLEGYIDELNGKNCQINFKDAQYIYDDITSFWQKARDGDITYATAKRLSAIDKLYQDLEMSEDMDEYNETMKNLESLVKDAISISFCEGNSLIQANELEILSRYSFE